MKIRIDQNSFRFRLTVQEVDTWKSSAALSQTMHLPMGLDLSFSLIKWDNPNLKMESTGKNDLIFYCPQTQVELWINDEHQNGFYGEFPNEFGELIAMAVEKDYACSPAVEAEFPNLYFRRPNEEKSC